MNLASKGMSLVSILNTKKVESEAFDPRCIPYPHSPNAGTRSWQSVPVRSKLHMNLAPSRMSLVYMMNTKKGLGGVRNNA